MNDGSSIVRGQFGAGVLTGESAELHDLSIAKKHGLAIGVSGHAFSMAQTEPSRVVGERLGG